MVDLDLDSDFFDILGCGVVKLFFKGSSGKKSSPQVPQVLLGRSVLMLC